MRLSEELRIRAVCRVLEGESPKVVIKALGMRRTRIYKWLRSYQDGGFVAILSKPIPGEVHLLSEDQKEELFQIISATGIPRDFVFKMALWTLPIIRELTHRNFGVRYTVYISGGC